MCEFPPKIDSKTEIYMQVAFRRVLIGEAPLKEQGKHVREEIEHDYNEVSPSWSMRSSGVQGAL